MIKVIEEKQVPRAQVTCHSCGSVLEYGNGDLYKNYHTQVGINTVFQEYYFNCPVCGCQVDAHWITRKEDKMTKQDIERMSTEYCKGFCTPDTTTPQYDVLDLDKAFCQGGEQVRDAMIEEAMLRLRELNLKQYIVLLMDSKKLCLPTSSMRTLRRY